MTEDALPIERIAEAMERIASAFEDFCELLNALPGAREGTSFRVDANIIEPIEAILRSEETE